MRAQSYATQHESDNILLLKLMLPDRQNCTSHWTASVDHKLTTPASLHAASRPTRSITPRIVATQRAAAVSRHVIRKPAYHIQIHGILTLVCFQPVACPGRVAAAAAAADAAADAAAADDDAAAAAAAAAACSVLGARISRDIPFIF